MPDETITIISGNTTDHSLDLSDGGHTKTTKGKKIKWEITDDTINVLSIENIQRKSGDDIFSEPPKKEDRKKWKAKIKDSPPECGIYVYSISWTDNEGKPHTYDPIISVNPTGFNPQKLLIALVSFLLGLFTLKLLSTKRNKK